MQIDRQQYWGAQMKSGCDLNEFQLVKVQDKIIIHWNYLAVPTTQQRWRKAQDFWTFLFSNLHNIHGSSERELLKYIFGLHTVVATKKLSICNCRTHLIYANVSYNSQKYAILKFQCDSRKTLYNSSILSENYSYIDNWELVYKDGAWSGKHH